MKTRGCQKNTPYDLARLFNKAYGRASTLEKATKRFERSGIWPLNPEAFGEEDVLPARNLGPTIIADEELAIKISVPSNAKDAATPSSAHQSASNSTFENLTSPIPVTPPHISDTNSSRHPTTNIGTLNSTIPPSSGSLQHVTFRKRSTVSVADASPIPRPSNATDKNPLTKRRKTTNQRSEILTVSSIEERLEEAERRRSLKLAKTPKTSSVRSTGLFLYQKSTPSYVKVKDNFDLSSHHFSAILTLSKTILIKENRSTLTNHTTLVILI
ncbi:hypothetical protein ILUMI_12040 [Ignelater luminosus]|uniref:Uncharacterized protein n=1 Tax=Ignelater luminosus TaxID=2038154 RepID=A0A8K0G9X7_IGNLU|nr:hypothetical protein ILUMI_12040 [Ignelater luminosus]